MGHLNQSLSTIQLGLTCSQGYNNLMLIDLAIGLIGLSGGMLVNYLSDILPIKRRLGRPICLHCGEAQPVKNYLLWPRRCENCSKMRPLRTWIVEIIAITIALVLSKSPEMHMQIGYFLGGVVLIYFGVVLVIDIELRLILHPVSVIGALLGFAFGISLNGFVSTVLGGAVGFGIMFGFHYIGHLYTKGLAKLRGEIIDEVALGFGDVNLTGVLGLLLGWPNIIIGILLSIITAGLFSLIYIVVRIIFGRYRSLLAIPYGPFLILGAILLLFFPLFTQRILAGMSPFFASMP